MNAVGADVDGYTKKPLVLEAMRRLQERDGMPLSEQIRRALRPWLEAKGVIKEADRKRAAARKRP
jgi:hypothetical protein